MYNIYTCSSRIVVSVYIGAVCVSRFNLLTLFRIAVNGFVRLVAVQQVIPTKHEQQLPFDIVFPPKSEWIVCNSTVSTHSVNV